MTEITELAGIAKGTVEKLKNLGILTIEDLATTPYTTLSESSERISEDMAKKVVKMATQQCAKTMFLTGSQIFERRKTVNKLSLCVPDFDELMGGGIETQCITEVYGEFGCGKSQIAHQLAVNVQLPFKEGGLEGGAIYIDSEGSFRPNRIEQMAEGYAKIHPGCTEFDVQDVLDNIHVAYPSSSSNQILLMETAYEIAKDLKEAGKKEIKLVIVDSLTSHFRAEFMGRDTLPERQGLLHKHMQSINSFAKQMNAVALVTNQVMSAPGTFFGDPTRPVGGNIVGHTSKYRIYLRKAKAGTRVAKLVDAPDLPDGEAAFAVIADGVISH